MVSEGLIQEIRNFYEKFVKPFNDRKDYSKGILQTIGFKEFAPYLEKYDDSHDEIIQNYMRNEKSSEVPPPESLTLLTKCLDELKLVTRRYSKKQIKWVSNRLLGCQYRQVPLIYALDTSYPENWNTVVSSPAADVVSSYIEDRTPELKPLDSVTSLRHGYNEEVTNTCDICKRVFIGEFQWEIHLNSNKHKKMKKRTASQV